MRERVWLPDLSPVSRCAIVGAASAGVTGALAGLVIGLLVYAPTAWFAVLELGLPAALLGTVVGALVGVIVTATRRRRDAPASGAVTARRARR